MKKDLNLLRNGVAIFMVLLTMCSCNSAKQNQIQLSEHPSGSTFPIVSGKQVTSILIDTCDAEVVNIVAQAVAHDVELITGIMPEIINDFPSSGKNVVIAGTIGYSKLIDELIAVKKINVDEIQGKWESHQLEVVSNPSPGVDKALVIVGSDRRGTAYGLFELSKILGVSPWVWWADVLPEQHKNIYLTAGKKVIVSPSVKYRGIFLNDEDWGLQPWAAKNHDKDIQDIGPNTYAKIFELLLRLKANFIWPAMHNCTKAFYYYPENPKVADRYAIVVGASHCEPMNRNNVFEWNENFENEYGQQPGDWRYDTNKDQINRYWDDRIKVSSKFENFYTVGMRGIHDSGMPGPKDSDQKVELLEEVISGQRSIFENYFKKATDVPQLFCPYKEVLSLYQHGLNLPDDVTVVWADDNHGYIRQLSTPEEQKRSGRSGVYYHISYWGKPHDFLWLSSISPSQISYEMSKAYQFGADRLWVLNVGDIKPAELETEFFMDFAWDVEKWKPQDAHDYAQFWAEKTFGKKLAPVIAKIKADYYRLAQNGKPEHLRMLHFDDEIKKERLTDYEGLMTKVDELESQIPDRLKDAFYELIKYPVYGAALMNQKILCAEMSLNLAEKGDKSAIEMADKAKRAYEQIIELTRVYNDEVANGKWNKMISWRPRRLPVFDMPLVATSNMIGYPEKIIKVDVTKNKYLDDIEGASDIKSNKTSKMSASILGGAFRSKIEQGGEQIKIIQGLGLGGQSVSRYPFTGKSYTKEEVDQAPSIEYMVKLEPGNYQLSVKCLPAQRIHEGRSVSYAISVNGSVPKVVNVDVARSQRYWIPSVIRGFSEGISEFQLDGKSTIRIYLMDTNIAISKIDILKSEEI